MGYITKILMSLLAIFMVIMPAAADPFAVDMAKKTFAHRPQSQFAMKNELSEDIKAYERLTDIIMGRVKGSLKDQQETIAKTKPALQRPITLFQNFNKTTLERAKTTPEFKDLISLTHSSIPDEAYMANWLLATYHIERGNLIEGLPFIQSAMALTADMKTTPETLSYRYDINSVALNAYALDRNIPQVLSTLSIVLELSSLTNRQVDNFTIVNNVAFSYYHTGQYESALDILETSQAHLNHASTTQRAIYYYSLSKFHNGDKNYDAALNAVNTSLNIKSYPRLTYHNLILKTRVLTNTGDLKAAIEAKESLLQAVSNDPDAPEFTIGLLEIDSKLAELSGDHAKALKLHKEWSESTISHLKNNITQDRRNSTQRMLLSQELSHQQMKNMISEHALKDEIIAGQKNRFRVILIATALLLLASISVAILNKWLRQAKNDAETSRDAAQKSRVIAEQSQAAAEAARDQAKAGEKAKAQILGAMSHEFRTPLNSIIPVTELIGYTHSDPQTKKYLSMIRRAGERLLEMIENLYFIAHAETGQTLLTEPVHLRRQIIEISKPWASEFKAKNITFDANMSANMQEVYHLQKNTLGIILNNLLSNALKFSKGGQVDLKVLPHQDTGLKIIISDNGIGIDLTHIKDYLSAFTQSDMSMSRDYEGLGIGLSAVKIAIDSFGGNIHFAENTPKGTIVTVTLPDCLHETTQPQKQAA